MNELSHHGIKGQHWGVRHGPPYPLRGGTYQPIKKKKVYKESRVRKNTKNDKLHIDSTIKEGTEFQTLTRDANRLKDADFYYATYDKLDNAQFRKMFNSPKPQPIFDENGKQIGVNKVYKMNAKTVAKSDIKVASADSQGKAFRQLYENDRDFYNFVRDSSRLIGYIKDTPWGWIIDIDGPGNSGKSAVSKMQKKSNYVPSEKELNSLCRIFTTTLPNDGTVWKGAKDTGVKNESIAKDMATQRAKFFKQLKNNGYGAFLDIYDAVDHRFNANAPVVVFDMNAVIPKEVQQLTLSDVKQASKEFSEVKRFFTNFKKG